ncbi:MAG TPA: xanthine dehydrogenase family protein molybdopterin-binding subunit [Tepidisphaeraceae bacterium]|jgi:xanthine dehydrogenase YagR molybdenum-binding subunit|nr:xanthine dehydrogenase family protein molybdopterin-binding subunit [Tepidisphaeraceae bacterium]
MAERNESNSEILSWGPNDKHRLLNTRLPRVDFPYKTTGTAIYTYDVSLPGMLQGRILCSPHAKATIKSLDLSPALRIPGVKAAVKRLDVGGMLRFEGDPIAAVAATTAEIAEDAVLAIQVTYNELPFVVTADDAIKPGAPAVYPDDPAVINNTRVNDERGDSGKVADALKSADAVVEAEYRSPTLHHTCLETHAVVVDYRGGDSATVYVSTQGTFSIPGDAARTLDLDESNVTGIVQYMGGGFGSKGGIGVEGQLACRLSKQAGVPVKMALPRRDEFIMAGNGPGSIQKFRAGVSRDGKLLAVQVEEYGLGGIGGARLAGQPYVYRAENIYRKAGSIHTNEDAARPLRAPGHPPACFAMESLMDELAYKIGMDPVEFRIRNLPENDVHIRQLQRGAKEIGWDRRSRTPGGWPGTVKRGFGCACGVWGGGGRAQCVVDVSIGRDGAVIVSCGSQDLGTGTRTYMVAIVAEELGLEMGDVHEKIGDTRLTNANYSGGSTTAASLSPAVKVAAINAKAEIAKALAPVLGANADDIVFADRKISAGGKTLTWSQACAALPSAGISVRGKFKRGLSSNGTHGACFAEVEVDTETGHVQVIRILDVQDCGLPLNRLAVESQINGGMVQGIGMALLEGRVMDARLGVMINSSFMDYKIPGCLEMPREMLPLIDDDDPRQQVVGVGEPPSVPPAAAIANAIYSACGVRVRELPITPDKVLMGLMGAKA